MQIHDLEYYQQLVIQKNFSKVAKFFEVSQPTISSAIKRLEDEFATKLVIRGNSQKELIFTTTGEQLYQHAKVILNELNTAKNEIKRMNTRTLLLGLPPIIESVYFAKIAKTLMRDDFIENITTVEAGSNSLRSSLNNGEIDIALLGSIGDQSESILVTHEFAKSNFSVFVASSNPLAQKKALYFSELHQEKFVMFKSSFVHTEALKILAKNAHFTPEVQFKSNDLHFLMNMIGEDVGVSILADVVDPARDDIVAIPLLDDNQPQFHASIAYRKNHILTPQEARLLSILTSEL
ncbi:LysR family transcriptional regulator [Weissella muntiaci]|uniref:LysR family transcriptional regulator n=1 Tax=Weissella muntiaci TaxID=2508881 RepID=A0A6C2C5G1_9LACO|nr:LysR family transcriptional regulator [Weissella muntiaci]TYC49097.1 LysR family transcriptional regulator [Weissella muntiaci]